MRLGEFGVDLNNTWTGAGLISLTEQDRWNGTKPTTRTIGGIRPEIMEWLTNCANPFSDKIQLGNFGSSYRFHPFFFPVERSINVRWIQI